MEESSIQVCVCCELWREMSIQQEGHDACCTSLSTRWRVWPCLGRIDTLWSGASVFSPSPLRGSHTFHNEFSLTLATIGYDLVTAPILLGHIRVDEDVPFPILLETVACLVRILPCHLHTIFHPKWREARSEISRWKDELWIEHGWECVCGWLWKWMDGGVMDGWVNEGRKDGLTVMSWKMIGEWLSQWKWGWVGGWMETWINEDMNGYIDWWWLDGKRRKGIEGWWVGGWVDEAGWIMEGWWIDR